MLTRRDFVTTSASAGAALPLRDRAQAAIAPPKDVPSNACDTHVHVLNPVQFPYSAKRRYTPGPATVEQLLDMEQRLGTERIVVVQNSVYGSDNTALLDALKKLGTARSRGVAVIDDATSVEDLTRLHQAGVRGVRLNLEVSKDRDASQAALQVSHAASRLPPGWHVHINAALSVVAQLRGEIERLPQPVVLDHFAHTAAEAGIAQAGFSDLIALLRAGKVIVKLSGPYQISQQKDYSDIAPVARAMVEAGPGHVMWGSDWPHTGGAARPADQAANAVEPFRPEDDVKNFDLLPQWVPDPAVREALLVATPARIYGFG